MDLLIDIYQALHKELDKIGPDDMKFLTRFHKEVEVRISRLLFVFIYVQGIIQEVRADLKANALLIAREGFQSIHPQLQSSHYNT